MRGNRILVKSRGLCHCGPVISGSFRKAARLQALLACLCLVCGAMGATAAASGVAASFPLPLSEYPPQDTANLWHTLVQRASFEPFNLVATALFLCAILHTFMAPVFLRFAHKYEHAMEHLPDESRRQLLPKLRFRSEIFHLLGEVEAVFGIWVLPLMIAITLQKGWSSARDYIGHGLNFTEPLFVVVIMTIAASRPILNVSEQVMSMAARLGNSSPAAWWLSILTIGPLLGSFITEPAAITISALLLARKFYIYAPPAKLAYATLGLLFVNVSVGGTLTHFAAPPVLMVAGKWGWGFSHMLQHFGWKAALGIITANSIYLLCFRRQFKKINESEAAKPESFDTTAALQLPVPAWITAVHIFFLGWTVMNNHYPPLFVGGFLFYLAFTKVTEDFQSALALRPALLVGFFLAGLVVHGGLQGWWIAPVLSGLSATPLFTCATVLTAFNDNAAITYLASLVPDFSDALKHAVVAGAVVGGGLTVIANAPNPAGQSILSRFFPNGVSPVYLFLGALMPTAVMAFYFLAFATH